jgi:hypothetical protein
MAYFSGILPGSRSVHSLSFCGPNSRFLVQNQEVDLLLLLAFSEESSTCNDRIVELQANVVDFVAHETPRFNTPQQTTDASHRI